VVHDELSTWGLDHPPAVGGGVVGLTLSEGNTLRHFVEDDLDVWITISSSALLSLRTPPKDGQPASDPLLNGSKKGVMSYCRPAKSVFR
jgi:hypothetical protein